MHECLKAGSIQHAGEFRGRGQPAGSAWPAGLVSRSTPVVWKPQVKAAEMGVWGEERERQSWLALSSRRLWSLGPCSQEGPQSTSQPSQTSRSGAEPPQVLRPFFPQCPPPPRPAHRDRPLAGLVGGAALSQQTRCLRGEDQGPARPVRGPGRGVPAPQTRVDDVCPSVSPVREERSLLPARPGAEGALGRPSGPLAPEPGRDAAHTDAQDQARRSEVPGTQLQGKRATPGPRAQARSARDSPSGTRHCRTSRFLSGRGSALVFFFDSSFVALLEFQKCQVRRPPWRC